MPAAGGRVVAGQARDGGNASSGAIAVTTKTSPKPHRPASHVPAGSASNDGALRSNAAGAPPRLVLGFGNTSVRAIRRGIATIAPVLNPDV